MRDEIAAGQLLQEYQPPSEETYAAPQIADYGTLEELTRGIQLGGTDVPTGTTIVFS